MFGWTLAWPSSEGAGICWLFCRTGGPIAFARVKVVKAVACLVIRSGQNLSHRNAAPHARPPSLIPQVVLPLGRQEKFC